MKSFKDLGIENKHNTLMGEKIKMDNILNILIYVRDFKIEKSKFTKNKTGDCLYLQIEVDGEIRIVFTGSDVLINTIREVDKKDLPFSTTIKKLGECFIFD